MRIVAIVALAAGAAGSACWTAPAPAPVSIDNRAAPSPVVPPSGLDAITMSRTACAGRCPVYSVTIRRDGTVDWTGEADVALMGHASAHVDRGGLAQIEVALDASRFYDRDTYAKLPQPPCVTADPDKICLNPISTCSDTSQTTITVKHGGATRAITDLHCDQDPDLTRLETVIGDIANTAPWIGR